jgi:glyoxylase-like metal-dependent hydrolase (beta-lactamase superfamily II)
VQHNCLLLERQTAAIAPGSPLGSPRLVLIETGTGDKMDAKSRDIFALEERSILDALHECDCRPEDIEAAIVTHLHFDHAGGLTRRVRPGERPDWTPTASDPRHKGFDPVKLTFPNARVHAQGREWTDALANRSVMTRTYFADHLDPIASHIVRADSPRPWPVGFTPGRDELPPVPIDLRMTEVAPGIHVFLAPGHTWGQQAVAFTDPTGQTIVFTPDVMPTVHHAGAAYSLGYDVEPYTSMVSRHWLLAEAADRGWILVLDHEPGNPLQRVKRNDKGWFDLVPVAV